MSEFPEIQPFGPGPASHNAGQGAEVNPVEAQTSAPTTTQPAEQNKANPTFAILVGVGVGFVLGYIVSRYEQTILRQTKLDEFLEYAQDWIREQGPKIAEPLRQSLESTGSTVEQAIKKVSAAKPLDSFPFLSRSKR